MHVGWHGVEKLTCEEWSNPTSKLPYREVERGLGAERRATDYLLYHVAQTVQVPDFALKTLLGHTIGPHAPVSRRREHAPRRSVTACSLHGTTWGGAACKGVRSNGGKEGETKVRSPIARRQDRPQGARPRSPAREWKATAGKHVRMRQPVRQTVRRSGRAAVGRAWTCLHEKRAVSSQTRSAR